MRWKEAAKKYRAMVKDYEKIYGALSEANAGAITRILNSLAEASGRKFRGKAARNMVRKLLVAGFTETEVTLVNIHMSNKWKSDPKMATYLRPNTLYGNKFEGYLNDAILNCVPKNPYAGARVL